MMFRAKSTPVEARQWTGDNVDEMRAWLGYAWIDQLSDGRLLIENRDGRVIVNLGEWITRDEGFQVWEPILFAAKYEACHAPD